MEDFIQAEDYEVWVRITNGPLTPTITDSVPKLTEKYGKADYKMLRKNAKAKCILIFGLGPEEFNHI